MPVKHYTDTNILDGPYAGRKYPNPFFDLANNYIPKNIKTLFSYCRTFFYTNAFIRNVVSKLTEYPITEILVDAKTDPIIREKWDSLLNNKLKLKSLLIEIGLDYYTYGNAFISIQIKIKRYLKCPSCKVLMPITDVPYKIKKFQFYGNCPKCQAGGVIFTVEDDKVKSVDNIKFVRWSPENIDIDYNPITNSSEYYYALPAALKAKILKGNKHILNTLPLVFLESLQQKKRIVIDSDNFYHFKRPTLAEDDMGWGKPIILPALKLLYYLQTLQRGQEAIAVEHIIPKKSIYPANTTTLDPYSMHPDTLVYTTDGVMQLAEVPNSAVKLLTETGEATAVVDFKLRTIEDWDYMLDIKSYGLFGIPTKVNSVHPFRVYNTNTQTYEWKRAKDLSLNDLTAYPIKSYEDYTYNNQAVQIAEYRQKAYRAGTQSLPDSIVLDNNFARFIGLFIAEGYTGPNGMVGFGFHVKEESFHNFCANFLDTKLLPNTATEIKIRDKSCDVRKNSVYLKDFLDNFVGRGYDKKTIKHIMRYIGNNTELQTSLLSGIYDGDGTFFYEKARYARLNLKLANLPLIAELRDLLLHMGYYPTIVKDDSSTNRAWSLKLYGYEAEHLATKLGYETKNLYSAPKSSKNHFIKNGFVYSKLQQITAIPDREVMSIEVGHHTHSYLSVGYTNKNTQMNLGKWKGKIEEQIKKWRTDPNHIGVFPIPIGYQELGGNARALMLTPEMKFLEEEIINSLGVPLEFIKGGSTFTSGSVSLRIVENHFLNYRELLRDFLNYFVVSKITQYLDYPSVTLNFKKFKMADDIQAKQVVMNLNQAGKLSDAKMLEEFGYNYETENTAIDESLKFQRSRLLEDNKAQAKAQGEATVIGGTYQVRAQKAMEQEQLRIQTEMFQEELSVELQAIPEEPHKIIDKYALEISMMDEAVALKTIQTLAKTMPTTATLIQSRLAQLQSAALEAEIMMEEQANVPGPTTKEESAPAEPSPDTKQKGPTKGNV